MDLTVKSVSEAPFLVMRLFLRWRYVCRLDKITTPDGRA